MQYGVFSDIHGNLDALRAVWAALEGEGLAGGPVLNAGDTVGYGPDPEGCVRFLRDRPNVVSVKGNYDRNVSDFPVRRAEYRRKWGLLRPEKFEAIARDSAAVSDETRAWLAALPTEEALTLAWVSVILTHYSPGSKDGLGTWTPDGELRARAQSLDARGLDARVVVCGHTHTDFVRPVGGVLWVNPGSLGRSLDGRFRYAVLSLAPGLPPSVVLKLAPRPPTLDPPDPAGG